jgi:hypothetical protein
VEVGNGIRPSPLLMASSAGGNIQFGTDDRFDPLVFTFCIKFYGAEHATVIGNGHGRHILLLDLFYQVLKPDCAVKKGILGVEMEMNERHKREHNSFDGTGTIVGSGYDYFYYN